MLKTIKNEMCFHVSGVFGAIYIDVLNVSMRFCVISVYMNIFKTNILYFSNFEFFEF